MWLIAHRPQSCWTLDMRPAPSTPGGPAAPSLPPSAASSSSSSSSFSPSQPSLHLSSFSASRGHSPGWMECVLSKYLFNEWLIDVYLFSLHEADGLVAFTVWWRFQATSGFDNLSSVPRKPLDEQHLPSCLGLDFFIFATWHVSPLPPPEQTNFFFPIKRKSWRSFVWRTWSFCFFVCFQDGLRPHSQKWLVKELSAHIPWPRVQPLSSCMNDGKSSWAREWLTGIPDLSCNIFSRPQTSMAATGILFSWRDKRKFFHSFQPKQKSQITKRNGTLEASPEGLSDFQCREEKSRQAYNKPPTYQQVLFQEWVHKSNLFESPTKLA